MDICQVDQMNRKEFIEMVFCTNEMDYHGRIKVEVSLICR